MMPFQLPVLDDREMGDGQLSKIGVCQNKFLWQDGIHFLSLHCVYVFLLLLSVLVWLSDVLRSAKISENL